MGPMPAKQYTAAELSAMPFEEGFHKLWLMWLETPAGKAHRKEIHDAISESSVKKFWGS